MLPSGEFPFTVSETLLYIALGLVPYLIFGGSAWAGKQGYPPWIPRKIVHIFGMTVIVFYLIILPSLWAILFVASITTIVAILLTITPYRFIITMAKFSTREDEHWTLTLVNLGITFGVLVSLYFYLKAFSPYFPAIFLTSILSLAWGDGFAEIIGRKYGRHHYKIVGNKSVEGSVTVFLATFIWGIILFAMFGTLDMGVIVVIVICSLIATIVEAFSVGFLDNIAIPFVVTLTLWIGLEFVG